MNDTNPLPTDPFQSDTTTTLPSRIPYYHFYLPEERRSFPSLVVAIGLFLITVISCLAAGSEFAVAYAAGHGPDFDDFFADYFHRLAEPRLLLAGAPFALTLLGILLAHELGHFFACRHHRIHASYPFFIPAPTLIGTLGAFIRMRSPVINRRALFDVALAGPLIGFLIAVPTLGFAIAHSKVLPPGAGGSPLIFGQTLLERLFEAWLRPGVGHVNLLLDPVGRAAWVGLFATALNLIPAGQLDGGHILYSLVSRRHRLISIIVALALVPMSLFWVGWLLWAALLFVIAFRHPPVLYDFEPLGRARSLFALAALAMFLLCFMPAPFII